MPVLAFLSFTNNYKSPVPIMFPLMDQEKETSACPWFSFDCYM
jgi:hypothetical protein